jgi:hypothetical protein
MIVRTVNVAGASSARLGNGPSAFVVTSAA